MTTTRDDELREPPAQGPSKRPSKEQARQGQNIRGILTVMLVSIGLVVSGFVVVVAFSREPATTPPAPAADTRSGTP